MKKQLVVTKSKSYEVFMNKEFKAVIAPSSDLVVLSLGEMKYVYNDLKTWALPINERQLNQ